MSRPQGPGIDIGAFEFEYSKLFLPLVLRNRPAARPSADQFWDYAEAKAVCLGPF